MAKKKSINSILDELHFTVPEKKAFGDCIQLVKEEQRDGEIDAESLMFDVIKEVTKDEI